MREQNQYKIQPLKEKLINWCNKKNQTSVNCKNSSERKKPITRILNVIL